MTDHNMTEIQVNFRKQLYPKIEEVYKRSQELEALRLKELEEEKKRPSPEDLRCKSMNPDNPTMQCGLPKGHVGNHSKAPYHSWREKE